MIRRFYKDGEKLDVAGLNKIIVLLDRSETELTEIGLNEWRPNLDGPPHKHDSKDQIFYVTSGEGIIKLGNQKFNAQSGSLAYVPMGLVHQTVTTSDEPFCYMLFNIFDDPSKEGHASFADHIEKVKQIRKQQAERGQEDIDTVSVSFEIKPAKFLINVNEEENVSKYTSKQLLTRKETNKCEMELISITDQNKFTAASDNEKEQSIFVIEGSGVISIDNESENIKAGDLVFVPRKSSYAINAIKGNIKYLCLSALL
jgi:mannose-6-phosphate isomerase-like protein (cupin superfamily)